MRPYFDQPSPDPPAQQAVARTSSCSLAPSLAPPPLYATPVPPSACTPSPSRSPSLTPAPPPPPSLPQPPYFTTPTGSCFFLPHGTRLYNRLVEIIRGQYWLRGYNEIVTPNMYNLKLWETSGHAAKYKENMFCIDIEGQEC